MTSPLWRLDRVTQRGRRGPRLDDVSLEIPPGRTAVVGASGAGKTSLLNLLVGFEKPHRGSIEQVASSFEPGRLPLAWVPPDDGLWPHLTVREHVEIAIPPCGKDRVNAERVMKFLDLNSLAKHKASALSRGERSRVSMARALACRPCVIVADEPLSHVDLSRSIRYWTSVSDRMVEDGISFVIATHDPKWVLAHCDHAIGVDRGEIIYTGDVETLYCDPPDERSAWLLGPINWLSKPREQKRIVAEGDRPVHRVRPEWLEVVPTGDGPYEVWASNSYGSLSRSRLVSQSRGGADFIHRPTREPLRSGMKVALKVLTCLLLTLFAPGCEQTEYPELDVSAERTIMLPPRGSLLPAPRAITIGPDDERYVLDNAGRVMVFSAAGEVVRQWDMPDFEAGNPEGLCLLDDGRIVDADTHYYRIVYFSPEGEFLKSVGSRGEEPGQFQRPSGLVWHDDRLYVADAFNSRIQMFDGDGKYLGTLGGESAAALRYPYELKLGPDGRFYVAEYAAGRVMQLDLKGQPRAAYGSAGRGKGQFATPWGLAVDSQGTIWVADTGNRRIVELIR